MSYQTSPPIIVVKVGGNEIDDAGFLAGFAATAATLVRQVRLVIVHGGGKEIGSLHEQLGVSYQFVHGLRATSPESLHLVEMVLCGAVNTRLTRWLVNAGVDALGLSGVDLGLIRVQPLRPEGRDIGLVGQVSQVRAESLHRLLAGGLVPVVAPISLGLDGQSYNVNADQVAAALAAALPARQLVFVSNVAGVYLNGLHRPPASRLTVAEAEAAIADGQITAGMVPKVRSALEAVAAGVQEAVITNLDGLANGQGTAVR